MQLGMCRAIGAAISLTAILWSGARAAKETPNYVWIEGTKPTKANVEYKLEGSSHGECLSTGKILQFTVDPGDVDKKVPTDGADFQYAFHSAGADYQVWARIGYEYARCPFEWRIDQGAWKTVKPNDLTTDLIELDFFREIAWIQLGAQQLSAGEHTLEFRVPRYKNAKGEPQRTLFALDAACLSVGPFYPNGKWQPRQDWQNARDKAAAANVFKLPDAAGPQRAAVELKGDWEICRDDEPGLPGPVDVPMVGLPAPAAQHWVAISVPADKAESRSELLFAHRVWYRTRVDVPASTKGRSFVVHFPENNLNSTVVVNGQLCGFNANPFAPFSVDVTRAIKLGQTNELCVGIRDAWYGYYRDAKDPMTLRRQFNLPPNFLGMGFQQMVYPEWNHPQSGILTTPTFTAAGGPAYASDVFVKPTVSGPEEKIKKLAVEVTVNNPSAADVSGEVLCEAIDPATGKVAKTLPPQEFSAPAGKDQVVSVDGNWADAKLWWPDPNPQLYTLRTTVRVGDRPVDSSDVTFGFRQWRWDGGPEHNQFTLNGVIWHGWADCFTAANPDDWLKFYREHNERFMRFWSPSRWFGMPDADALAWFDKNGVVVRRTNALDGEGMGYSGDHVEELGRNWIRQQAQQIRGERNHPSIMIWSLENEISFINAANANWLDRWEIQSAKMWDAVHNGFEGRSVDPTRPAMVDGHGAGKARALPVHGDHYSTGAYDQYPALAYEPNIAGGTRNATDRERFWDQKRPRFIGEELYASGQNPAYAYFGGEQVFSGKAGNRPAIGVFDTFLQQGYRFAGYGAWHFWQGQDDADGTPYKSYAPIAAFCKEWDSTFSSGQQFRRMMAVFNDTHDDARLVLNESIVMREKELAHHLFQKRIAAGTREQLTETYYLPEVQQREQGTWTLTIARDGKEVFRDVKTISVLPPAKIGAGLSAGDLAVLDPKGGVAALLKKQSVPFTSVTDLKNLPAAAKVLLIANDALEATDSGSPALADYAAAGHRVVVLEQSRPLQGQGLGPAQMEPDRATGRIAFIENAEHPVFAGLKDSDFFTFAGDKQIVYRNAYEKPRKNARSLLQCGEALSHTALAEIPVGSSGLMLVCQVPIGENIADNAVAQTLLANMIDRAASYKLTYRQVAGAVGADGPLSNAINGTGVKWAPAADPLAAIADPAKRGIAIIAATPSSLKALAADKAKVDTFTSAGGYLILNGLTPEGLADYNKLVGVEHMIRPFGGVKPTLTKDGPMPIERVMLAVPRDPLTAGITTSDVALYSSKRIFPWADGDYTSPDEFSYIVDLDEVAPFGASPFGSYGNITNGFVNADGWPLIINFPPNKDGLPFEIPIEWPHSETFTEFTWIGNTNYWPTTQLKLIFGDDREHPLALDVKPTGDSQTFAINPPRSASKVTLQLSKWIERPGVGANLGIDNIYFKVRRSADFAERVKPMLNIGGMVHYPRGKGGVVLCNLKFMDREDVPGNITRKRSMLAAILRNLDAPFGAGGDTGVAIATLKFTPVDLSGKATQFRDERGWFGDKSHTLADLPAGDQTFAGVKYSVYSFATSPVPTAIMLGGPGTPNNPPERVTGIAVNQKADALCFLHTARIDRPLNPDELKKAKETGVWPELAKYIVHYADGQTAEVPVRVGYEIADYRQSDPEPLPGAALAWTKPYSDGQTHAACWSMRWKNPRPDVAIASIDLVYGKDKSAGVPVLLALTAAATSRP